MTTEERLARLIVKHLGACIIPLHAYSPDITDSHDGLIDPARHNAARAAERRFLEERVARIVRDLVAE